jgi:ABC-2 type transport system permease protein
MLIIFGIPLLASFGLHYQANAGYYIFTFLMLVVFSSIPVNIGIALAIVMSGLFDLKRLKKFVFSSGVITVIGIITLLRIFRPERYINPTLFANLKIFLSEVGTPAFILLPNRWYSESLISYINNNYGNSVFFTALLLLTSYLSVFFLIRVYSRYHYRGWSLLQGGGVANYKKGRPFYNIVEFLKEALFLKPLNLVFSFIERQSGSIFRKDFLYQFHDVKNIQHNLVLLSLVIVYLFSVASLPLDWEGYTVKLKYIISYFNIGLILIIIASLCSKLVYPAIFSEGNSLWIIKSAPLTSRRYIWTKFFFLFFPIFFIGQILTVFSSFFVAVDRPIIFLNILTVTALSFSLVSLAIVFSISDLRNATENGSDEEIKTGNTLYMIISVFFIFFTLFIEAIPIYLYFLKESVQITFTQKAWLIIGTVIFVLLLVNILVTYFSIRMSVLKFNALQLE